VTNETLIFKFKIRISYTATDILNAYTWHLNADFKRRTVTYYSNAILAFALENH